MSHITVSTSVECITTLFIFGPDAKGSCYGRYRIAQEIQSKNPNIVILGNCKAPINLGDLCDYRGRISRFTQVYIMGHGSSIGDKHHISLFSFPIPTESLFKVLAYASESNPLKILVHSCYGGLIARDAFYLPKGSLVITSDIKDAPTRHNRALLLKEKYYAIEKNLLLHDMGTGFIVTTRDDRTGECNSCKYTPELTTIIDKERFTEYVAAVSRNVLPKFDFLVATKMSESEVADMIMFVTQKVRQKHEIYLQSYRDHLLSSPEKFNELMDNVSSSQDKETLLLSLKQLFALKCSVIQWLLEVCIRRSFKAEYLQKVLFFLKTHSQHIVTEEDQRLLTQLDQIPTTLGTSCSDIEVQSLVLLVIPQEFELDQISCILDTEQIKPKDLILAVTVIFRDLERDDLTYKKGIFNFLVKKMEQQKNWPLDTPNKQQLLQAALSTNAECVIELLHTEGPEIWYPQVTQIIRTQCKCSLEIFKMFALSSLSLSDANNLLEIMVYHISRMQGDTYYSPHIAYLLQQCPNILANTTQTHPFIYAIHCKAPVSILMQLLSPTVATIQENTDIVLSRLAYHEQYETIYTPQNIAYIRDYFKQYQQQPPRSPLRMS